MSTLNGTNGTNEPPAIPDDLITLPEAAVILKLSRQSMLRWIHEGKIPGFRVGYRWRVSKQDVLDMIVRHGPKEANDRKAAINATLPPSKRELADREKLIDQRLREAGIRK